MMMRASGALAADRLISYVLALGCDVSGEYVENLVGGEVSSMDVALKSVPNATVRVPPERMMTLLSVLRVEHVVTHAPQRGHATFEVARHVTDAVADVPVAVLCLLPMSRREWQTQQRPTFDVDLLNMNSNSVFVKTGCGGGTTTTMMYRNHHSLATLMHRVRTRVFDLLSETERPRGVAALMAAFIAAHRRIERGWTMDNSPAAVHRRPWTVGRRYLVASSCCVCALCQDAFTDHDIVVVLSCKHAFHVKETTCGGMVQCLAHGGLTCPLCRASVVT